MGAKNEKVVDLCICVHEFVRGVEDDGTWEAQQVSRRSPEKEERNLQMQKQTEFSNEEAKSKRPV